jgi:poly(A) polymerase
MVGNHMGFVDVQRMRPATVRRLLARETFALELELHRLDCAASHRRFDNYVFLLDRLAEFQQTPPVPPPLLTGRDVLAAGLAPGPRVGELLRAAQELQLNGELASREAALAWLACQLSPEAPPDARP